MNNSLPANAETLKTSRESQVESLHTPTPWYLAQHTVCTTVPDKRGDNVASCCHRENPNEILSNAAFIVRACNSHATLALNLKVMIDAGQYGVDMIHAAADPKNMDKVDWKGIALHMYAAMNVLPEARAALKSATLTLPE